MKTDLLFYLCITGLVPVVFSIMDMYLIFQVYSYPQARGYCQAHYTDLVPVKTDSDLLNVRALAASQGVPWPLWIGLYNANDSWRWSLNDIYLSATSLQMWSSGLPYNGRANEACGAITTQGQWINLPCSNIKPFICYDATLIGVNRFVGVSSPQLNWTAARAFCKQNHTELAQAIDSTDNSLLQQLASGIGDSWFGLYRDTWMWSDHTKAQNIQWASGQPDNVNSAITCGTFYQGWINNEDYRDGHYFICYFTPSINQQILRLQVRSDPSLFDPAVQTSILALLKGKLRQHGMVQNITVTWRLHPDGNVFTKI